jgi:hypothetical protein
MLIGGLISIPLNPATNTSTPSILLIEVAIFSYIRASFIGFKTDPITILVDMVMILILKQFIR